MNSNQTSSPIVANQTTQLLYGANLPSFQHSLFITPEWIESVAINSSSPIYLHFYNEHQQHIAKLAGLIMPGSKRSGRYLYFYAGPALAHNQHEIYQQCIDALVHFCKSEDFTRFHIDCSDHLSGIPCHQNGGIPIVYSEYVMYFNQTPSFNKSFRYNVNKAIKNGAEFHHDNSPSTLNKLFELLNTTRELRYSKYGEKYSAFPFLHLNPQTMQNLVESGLAQLYYASVNDEIHCVRCALEKNGRIFGLMIASDATAYKLGLHHFIHYNLINQYHQQNALYYNISGTAQGDEGKGLSDFKASMGFERVIEYGKDSLYLTFPRTLLNPLIRIKKKKTQQAG